MIIAEEKFYKHIKIIHLGTSYGKEVYLGINDTADRWTEIPESEVPEPDMPHELVGNYFEAVTE